MRALLRRAQGAARSARQAVGSIDRANALRDLHIYGGLLLIGIGGWFGSAWPASRMWTAIAMGAILMVFGLFAPSRRTR